MANYSVRLGFPSEWLMAGVEVEADSPGQAVAIVRMWARDGKIDFSSEPADLAVDGLSRLEIFEIREEKSDEG